MGCLRLTLAVIGAASLPFVASATTVELADITTVDELGYECISGEHFEEVDDTASLAFSIGKKVRLPRTCLPDPCAGALTQRELSNITGTDTVYPRFREEWDEYYARYADYCRKEPVTNFAGDVAPQEEFWVPLRGNTTTPTRFTPNYPTNPSVFGGDRTTTGGDVSPSGQELSEVPLPAGWVFLASALAVLLRRKRA